MKKFLSIALTLTMVLALAIPAFAAAPDGSQVNEIAVAGEIEVPAMDVDVSATEGTLILNPYQMTVTVTAGDVTDAVIFDPVFITNASETAMNVSVSVTGNVSGNAKLAATAEGLQELTTNSAFIWFELKATDSADACTFSTEYDESNTAQGVLATRAVNLTDALTMGAGSDAETYAAFGMFGEVVEAPKTPWASTDTIGAAVVLTFVPTT